MSPDFAAIQRLRQLAHLALDLDGTIYKGGTLFPFSRPFLEQMRRAGVGCTFLTNNPSKSAADYRANLAKLGIECAPDQIYTSALATIDWLRRERPDLRRLFMLGTPSMAAEFAAAGFTLTADDPKDEPDAVLVGFDLTLTYAKLCRAAWWIKQGKPFIATNPDFVCPTDQPNVLVDCGSICAALEKAAGRAPDRVFGKPDPSMLTGIMARHQLRAEQIGMVGDRIYTDMLMAHRAGAVGVLVLTGEATAADAAAAQPPPHFVMASVGELGERIVAARG
ncbi:MAG: HAD-IIA family hydrolase [Verrucomicrobia bacterium]|nr:HAD-IIA family hydrolase [Verrucomicrobiota bacterium]